MGLFYIEFGKCRNSRGIGVGCWLWLLLTTSVFLCQFHRLRVGSCELWVASLGKNIFICYNLSI